MTKYITQVTLPNDENVYEIKDTSARDQISEIKSSLTSALRYRGTTTDSNLKDGATVTSLSGIVTTSDPFRAGDVVLKVGTSNGTKQNAPKEYIFNGTT